MKLGILATGITPDELIEQYGSYSDMFIQLFDQAGFSFEYEVYDVREDLFPADADQCDGWIITGSKFNVYHNDPWMQRLKALIIDIHASGKPMVGICFGHQIVAEAFGGRVEAFSGGWGVGLHRYDLCGSSEFMKQSGVAEAGSFAISSMHQDQVVVKPDNAETFACSDFCQYAGLVYDNQILTFQAHPEFNLAYEEELIELRKGSVIPEHTAEDGLKGLRTGQPQADSLMVAGWMVRFLNDRMAMAA